MTTVSVTVPAVAPGTAADPSQGNQPEAVNTPAPGTPEYDAAMAAKFDNRNGPVEPQPNATDHSRPDWLPPQYKTPEDFAKAHQELQAAYTRTSQELAAVRKESAPQATSNGIDPANATPQQAADAVAQAGLDINEFYAEFEQNGGLSEASYAKLEKAGFGRDVVDAHIEGQRALAALRRQQAFAIVGGEQNYRAMQQWALTALTPQEIQTFDKAVSSGDEAEMQFAIKSLAARFQQARGSNPALIQGQASNNGGVVAYRSTAEMIRDMSDPRYKTDPAFRADVERKVAYSKF